MKHIKESVSSLLKFDESWYLTLLTNWPTVMGDLHTKMCLEKAKETTLIIGVYEASWMQELYLLSPMLLKTVNSFLGKNYVKELRFKVASQKIRLRSSSFAKASADRSSFPASQGYAGHSARQERTQPPSPPLKERDLSQDEVQALAQIHDEQLRSALELLLLRCSQGSEK